MKGTLARRAAAALAGLGIVGGALAMAAPAQAGVKLYDGYNYSSSSKDFGVGYITYVGDDWNDRASSLLVSSPATYTVVYTDLNYGGYSKSFSAGSPDLRTWLIYSGRNWDNEISSFQ